MPASTVLAVGEQFAIKEGCEIVASEAHRHDSCVAVLAHSCTLYQMEHMNLTFVMKSRNGAPSSCDNGTALSVMVVKYVIMCTFVHIRAFARKHNAASAISTVKDCLSIYS